MKNRLFSIILSVILLCQGIAAFADTGSDAAAPIDTWEFQALSAMGLLNDDFLAMSADTEVTRAQFAGALYRLAGHTQSDNSFAIPFVDVNAATPHKDAIAYLCGIGVISGADGGRFEPDRAISGAEALKLALGILGYDDYAVRKYGGFPVGHINLARQIKLTKGIKTENYNAPLNAENAAALLYNCGITCVVEGKVYGSDGTVKYETSEDRYLLSVYCDIYFGEGVMKDNGIVSLLGRESSENTVVIGDKSYRTDGADYSGFLGQSLKFFYSSSDGIDTLLWAWTDPDRNKTLTLGSRELETDDSAYSLTGIVYWKGTSRQTAKVSKYADFVYNNMLCNDCGVDRIKPVMGEITLVDNNSDGEYDLVMVTEFKNMFVDAVSADKEFIIGKYGDTLVFDDYENVVIFKDGSRAELRDVPNNCILSLVESPDKKYMYIYVNGGGKDERLETVSERNSDTYYTFESGKYIVAESLKKLIADGGWYIPEITAGNIYTYYLDMAGDVAAIESSTEGRMQYVYLLEGALNDDVFASADSAKFKLVLKDGTNICAVTASKVRINDGINDETGKTGRDLLEKVRPTPTSKVEKQVMKVAFNKDGEICEAELATPVSSEYGYDETKFTLDHTNGSSYYMSGNCCLFGYKYCVNGNTTCFAAFEDAEGGIEYGVIPFNQIAGNEYYSIKVYDCDRFFEAAAIEIAVKKYGTEVDGHVLVEDVGTILYSDGEVYKQLTGYSFGKLVAYRADDDGTIPDDIKRGDVVRVSVYNRKLSKVSLICRLSDNPEPFIKGGLGDEFCQIFGPLYANNGRMIVTVNPSGSSYGKLTPTSAWGTTTAFVAAYDAKKDKITITSVNAVQQKTGQNSDGSMAVEDDSVKVFIYRRYNYVKELIVAYY